MVWRPPNFPEEAPQINPDDKYEDPVKLIEYREWALRRKNINIEKAKVRRCRPAAAAVGTLLLLPPHLDLNTGQ